MFRTDRGKTSFIVAPATKSKIKSGISCRSLGEWSQCMGISKTWKMDYCLLFKLKNIFLFVFFMYCECKYSFKNKKNISNKVCLFIYLVYLIYF